MLYTKFARRQLCKLIFNIELAMKNIKFFLKCILALFPILAVILYTVLVPYGYMDIEYPAWKYTKDFTSKSFSESIGGSSADETAYTVILGDSRAMADLIPELIDESVPMSSTNLAVGGATSIEMYYTLNNLIKNGHTPEKAIIMFAPFHYSVIDNFWERNAYFNYLSVSDMYDLYAYAEAAKSETLLKSGYKNDLLSYRLRFPDKYLPALLNAKLFGRYSINNEEYNLVTSNHGYGEFGTADGCEYLNFETSYDRMHTTGDAVLLDIYMNKLLKLCTENGIDTILAVPPMNEASFNSLSSSYVEELTSYINDIKLKYPAILVDGDIPCYDNCYFGDSSHLNRKGAELFTEEFVDKFLK